MAISLFTPDPSSNCPSQNPSTCNGCHSGPSCSCPSDAEFTFTTKAPTYQLSQSDQQTLDAQCGQGSYTRLSPVDVNMSPMGLDECYVNDDSGDRIECYKCNGYAGSAQSMIFGQPFFANIGPDGSSVFIG